MSGMCLKMFSLQHLSKYDRIWKSNSFTGTQNWTNYFTCFLFLRRLGQIGQCCNTEPGNNISNAFMYITSLMFLEQEREFYNVTILVLLYLYISQVS